MTIDSLRNSLNTPGWYSMCNDSHPRRENPPDHLEPGGAMRKADNIIGRSDLLSRQNVALRKAVIRIMHREGLTHMIIGAIEMDHSDPQMLTFSFDSAGNAHMDLES